MQFTALFVIFAGLLSLSAAMPQPAAGTTNQASATSNQASATLPPLTGSDGKTLVPKPTTISLSPSMEKEIRAIESSIFPSGIPTASVPWIMPASSAGWYSQPGGYQYSTGYSLETGGARPTATFNPDAGYFGSGEGEIHEAASRSAGGFTFSGSAKPTAT